MGNLCTTSETSCMFLDGGKYKEKTTSGRPMNLNRGTSDANAILIWIKSFLCFCTSLRYICCNYVVYFHTNVLWHCVHAAPADSTIIFIMGTCHLLLLVGSSWKGAEGHVILVCFWCGGVVGKYKFFSCGIWWLSLIIKKGFLKKLFLHVTYVVSCLCPGLRNNCAIALNLKRIEKMFIIYYIL